MSEKLIINVNEIMENEEKDDERSRGLPGMTMTLTLFLVMAIFFVQLLRLKILPLVLLVAVGSALLILLITVGLLARDSARRGRCIFAILLTLILASGCLFGTMASTRILNTVREIIQPQITQPITMAVYVRADDPARSLNDIRDYELGVMKIVDRTQSDEALTLIEQNLGTKLTLKEYASPVRLITALLEKETDAILISTDLLSIAEGLTGFSADLVRILDRYELKIVVEDTTAVPTQPASAEPTEPLPEIRPDGQHFTASPGVYTIYISGIDDRSGLVSRSLSDVNIIAIVNTNTHRAALISTPRDYYVVTPVSGGEKDKLTHAGLYGVNVSRETLENLYDMDLDYIFRVDFSGFIRIIDAIGGVDVNVDQTFSSSGYTYTEGMMHMDGDMALIYARERKAFTAGDRVRGVHQMQLIEAVAAKVFSSELLTRYNSLLEALKGCFETTVPYDTLAETVQRQLSGGADWELTTYSVTGSDDYAETFTYPGNNYVMHPDWETVEKAKQLMWEINRN